MMKSKRKIELGLWVLLCMITIPLSAFGIDGQVEIRQTPTFPIVIDQPGNYVLTGDLIISTLPDMSSSNMSSPNMFSPNMSVKVSSTGKPSLPVGGASKPSTISQTTIDGIQINADDVILDLNGHTLIGPGKKSDQCGTGIYAANRNNVAVINGTVQGFQCGLSLSGANHEVKNISACSNSSNGIKVESSIITNCTANNNGSHGIYAESSTIADCTANNNRSHGIYAESSTIADCTANNNRSHGIYASGSRIEGCKLRRNKGYGLYLSHNSCYAIKNGAGENTIGNFYSDGLHHMPINTKGCAKESNLGQNDRTNYEFCQP